MDEKILRSLIKDLKNGRVDEEDVIRSLRMMPYDDLGFAKIDTHRDLRKGFPEVIFCGGKTPAQIRAIVKRSGKANTVMATRAKPGVFAEIKKVRKDAVYYKTARIVFAGKKRKKEGDKVLVVTGGTSDLPVAEEAAVTAEISGSPVERLFDVGVAGIHRLLDNSERFYDAGVVVVVAGMEGALASIVGGVARCPVVAVPTSIGYGAHFGGIAPLLSMLNSCAPGVTVVNIDNGFGAGYAAALIGKGRKK